MERVGVVALVVSLGTAVVEPARARAATARPDQAVTAVAGRYALHATARVRANPVVDRELETDGDVEIRPGRASGVVQLRVSAEGYACELAARAGERGELVLEPGQRCSFDVAEPEVRGHVDARLVSARGRVQGDELVLELSWELSGSLSLLVTGRRIELMGRAIEVPDAWAPHLPLRGTADTAGRGSRKAAATPRR